MKMKKNLAIVMSAVTAVGAVAPVVANAAVTTKNVTRDEAIKEAQKALDTVYSNKTEYADDNSGEFGKDAARSVYKVFLAKGKDVDKSDSDLITTVAAINTKDAIGEGTIRVTDVSQVRKAADRGDDFKLVILDKGHATVDGRIVNKKDTNKAVYGVSEVKNKSKNVVEILKSVNANKELLSKVVTNVAIYGEYGDFIENKVITKDTDLTVTGDKKVGKLVLTLKSGKTVELKLGEAAFDLTKPLNAAGEEIKDGMEDSAIETTASFKVMPFNEVDEDDTQEATLVGVDAKIFSVNKLAKTLEYKAEDIYTKENGYSEKGADIVNSLMDLVKGADKVGNLGGVNYKATAQLNKEEAKIEHKDGEYILKLPFKNLEDTVDSQKGAENRIKNNVDVIIKGKSLTELNKIRKDIFESNMEVVAGNFDTLIGKNRFQTAIEISKERFEQKGSADSVVIVGANAITDGLAAAPLASAKNAPVLLAGKGKLDADTIAEIRRAADKKLNKATVYIVGGKSSVSEDVEVQLRSEFGAVPVRLSGSDRYATSVSVAKRLYDDNDLAKTSRLFFTGGTGAADAMSVSAEAAYKTDSEGVSPIIIMKKDGFGREDRRDISIITAAVKEVYVVGGNSTVSYEGMQAVKKIAPVNLNADRLERISGVNRYATNAEVIKKFYGKNEGEQVARVFAASAFDNYLVDAQTAGALAASKEHSPLLLVGNKLDKTQKDLFASKSNKKNKNNFFVEGNTKLTQVGGAASSTAIKEIVKALDL